MCIVYRYKQGPAQSKAEYSLEVINSPSFRYLFRNFKLPLLETLRKNVQTCFHVFFFLP